MLVERALTAGGMSHFPRSRPNSSQVQSHYLLGLAVRKVDQLATIGKLDFETASEFEFEPQAAADCWDVHQN